MKVIELKKPVKDGKKTIKKVELAEAKISDARDVPFGLIMNQDMDSIGALLQRLSPDTLTTKVLNSLCMADINSLVVAVHNMLFADDHLIPATEAIGELREPTFADLKGVSIEAVRIGNAAMVAKLLPRISGISEEDVKSMPLHSFIAAWLGLLGFLAN